MTSKDSTVSGPKKNGGTTHIIQANRKNLFGLQGNGTPRTPHRDQVCVRSTISNFCFDTGTGRTIGNGSAPSHQCAVILIKHGYYHIKPYGLALFQVQRCTPKTWGFVWTEKNRVSVFLL